MDPRDALTHAYCAVAYTEADDQTDERKLTVANRYYTSSTDYGRQCITLRSVAVCVELS